MKYKKGKGRKIRRLQKAYKLKTGGGKFTFSGKASNWGNQAMVPLAIPKAEYLKEKMRKLSHRIGGDK